MRHGYVNDDVMDITEDDLKRFADTQVAYLAGMIKPDWLDYQKKLAPNNWQRNAKFALGQAIDGALFHLRAAAVTDDQRAIARRVVGAARNLMAGID